MKRHELTHHSFELNRTAFLQKMQSNSIAILISNDEMPVNADATYAYQCASDIFYLSGIDQEDTRLILATGLPFDSANTFLFIKQTNETIAVWEGYKYTKEHASKVSGVPIANIYWTHQFNEMLAKFMYNTEQVYLNTNEHERGNIHNEYADLRFARKLKNEYPLHRFERAAPMLKTLRAIKNNYEIEAIKGACAITESAFMRVLKMIQPGVTEYAIEAEIIHEFINNKAQGHAYTPIIASGASACVLHYIDNDKACNAGELVLMDFGCRKNNYAADLTRTVPVSGKFTERQKAVYNAVLGAYRYAFELMRPGATLLDMKNKVGDFIQLQLIDLGVISAEEASANPLAYRAYFMHGVSHHLGLDVHDFGPMHTPIEAGMVFTIEPGIYLPKEQLGIRIETDVVVQVSGNPIDLMPNIPTTVEEIEAAMQR
jgi:Xaa-Pro aminopeptidase